MSDSNKCDEKCISSSLVFLFSLLIIVFVVLAFKHNWAWCFAAALSLIGLIFSSLYLDSYISGGKDNNKYSFPIY